MEDAREIVEHLAGFARVLIEWQEAERTAGHEVSRRSVCDILKSMRAMIRPATFLACLVGSLLFFSVVSACICTTASLESTYRDVARDVFYGRVVSTGMVRGTRITHFEITKVWKGSATVGQFMTVRSDGECPSCGYEFKPGDEYLVFTVQRDGEVWTENSLYTKKLPPQDQVFGLCTRRLSLLKADATPRCLDAQIQELAGTGAINCGLLSFYEDPSAADSCMAAAYKTGRPFFYRYILHSMDSLAATAVAYNGTDLFFLNYDTYNRIDPKSNCRSLVRECGKARVDRDPNWRRGILEYYLPEERYSLQCIDK